MQSDVEAMARFNAGGIGIKLSYDDPAESPSEEIKQILKEGDDKREFHLPQRSEQWRKRIGKDANPRDGRRHPPGRRAVSRGHRQLDEPRGAAAGGAGTG